MTDILPFMPAFFAPAQATVLARARVDWAGTLSSELPIRVLELILAPLECLTATVLDRSPLFVREKERREMPLDAMLAHAALRRIVARVVELGTPARRLEEAEVGLGVEWRGEGIHAHARGSDVAGRGRRGEVGQGSE